MKRSFNVKNFLNEKNIEHNINFHFFLDIPESLVFHMDSFSREQKNIDSVVCKTEKIISDINLPANFYHCYITREDNNEIEMVYYHTREDYNSRENFCLNTETKKFSIKNCIISPYSVLNFISHQNISFAGYKFKYKKLEFSCNSILTNDIKIEYNAIPNGAETIHNIEFHSGDINMIIKLSQKIEYTLISSYADIQNFQYDITYDILSDIPAKNKKELLQILSDNCSDYI